MKVLVAGTRGIPEVLGGVETHCQNLYPLVANSGVDITVIARSPYVNYEQSTYKKVKLSSVWAPKLKSTEAIVHTFIAAIKSKLIGAKLIHIHAVGPGLLVPFCKLLGLKVVFTHHGPDYDRQKWGKAAKFILKLGERLAIKYADEVIVISNVINEIIKSNYDRHDANLIFNGVDGFNISKRISSVYLEKHGLEHKNYIVAVGRFVEEKGFHDLVKAYKNLNEDMKLVLIGDADHPTRYSQSLIDMASREKNIYLTGFVKGQELQSLFSSASCFVMPSYHEGLPIALLEAMSYSLPVIVSDIPANKEVNLSRNVYFETGNVSSLMSHLRRGIDKGFADVDYSDELRLYQWSDIAKKTVQVYKSAVNE